MSTTNERITVTPVKDRITLTNAIDLIEKKIGIRYKKRTMYAHVNDGNMPFKKAGKFLTFTEKELNEWCESKLK